MSVFVCHRRIYAIVLVMLWALALVVAPCVVLAEEGSAQTPENTAVRPSTGYITILLTGESNGSGATMTGGQISLYRVAAVDRSDPQDYRYDVSKGQFPTSGTLSGLNSMSSAELDARNPTIAENLEQEVAAKGIQPLQTANIKDGQAHFPQVEEGLYLLLQTQKSDANRQVRSFLLSVPNAQGDLGVTANPKPGAWDGIDPNKKDPAENEDEGDGTIDPQPSGQGAKKAQKDSNASGGKSAGSGTAGATSSGVSSVAGHSSTPTTADNSLTFVSLILLGATLVVVGSRSR